MPFRIISSPDPKYLAATDILISDMSNINYDFLLFDRPIILIANDWLIKNFPDIGIKTALKDLENAIEKTLRGTDEFKDARAYWHKKTMHDPDGNSSERVLNKIVACSNFTKPAIIFIFGGNEVSRFHMKPLFKLAKSKNYETKLISGFKDLKKTETNEVIFIATHNNIFKEINYGFKVHIDHSVKGAGVTDYDLLAGQYKENGYYPNTDLHVTEGETSYDNTKKLMGPFSGKVIIAGYPKSDLLIKANNPVNRKEVFKILKLDIDKPLITYAPTGKYRFPYKQGASLTKEVLDELQRISKKYDYNILVKLRAKDNLFKKIMEKIKKIIKR